MCRKISYKSVEVFLHQYNLDHISSFVVDMCRKISCTSGKLSHKLWSNFTAVTNLPALLPENFLHITCEAQKPIHKRHL